MSGERRKHRDATRAVAARIVEVSAEVVERLAATVDDPASPPWARLRAGEILLGHLASASALLLGPEASDAPDTAEGAQTAALRALRALVDNEAVPAATRAASAAALAKLASDAITQRDLVDRLRAVEGGTLPATGGT